MAADPAIGVRLDQHQLAAGGTEGGSRSVRISGIGR